MYSEPGENDGLSLYKDWIIVTSKISVWCQKLAYKHKREECTAGSS
jgi:hypothetical protein